MIQHYELLYIVSVKFIGAELEKIQNRVKELIQKAGGVINYEENLGKKRLAYPIKRNSQGFYIINEFNAEPNRIKELNDGLKLTSEILRHLIVKKRELTETEMRKTKTIEKEKISKMTAQFDIEKQLKDSKSKIEIKKKEAEARTATTKEKLISTGEKPKIKPSTEDEINIKKISHLAQEDEPNKEKKEDKNNNKIKLEELDKKLDEIIDRDII